jgi:hypothetical protein
MVCPPIYYFGFFKKRGNATKNGIALPPSSKFPLALSILPETAKCKTFFHFLQNSDKKIPAETAGIFVFYLVPLS